MKVILENIEINKKKIENIENAIEYSEMNTISLKDELRKMKYLGKELERKKMQKEVEEEYLGG